MIDALSDIRKADRNRKIYSQVEYEDAIRKLRDQLEPHPFKNNFLDGYEPKDQCDACKHDMASPCDRMFECFLEYKYEDVIKKLEKLDDDNMLYNDEYAHGLHDAISLLKNGVNK